MILKKYEHGGRVYDETGATENFFDFSANINPLGFPDSVRLALQKNFAGIVNYPDPDALELKTAICRRYDVRPENLVLLNGAAEFFYLYANTFRPKKVLIPVPSFSEYERAARAAGCDVEFFFTREEENFHPDVKKIIRQIKSEDADLIVIGRPNNPTGNLISLEEIRELAEVVPVLLDEAFLDFLPEVSAMKFVSEKISVVRSLTKIFAIPGLRLGFAVTDEKIAERLNFSKDVWNVNFLAQKAGAAALSDEKFLQDTRELLEREKKFFVERLKKIPDLKFFEPGANFILLKLNSGEVAENILRKLREEKILLRSCSNFPGLDERFLRSAIRSRRENIFLLDRLEKILHRFTP